MFKFRFANQPFFNRETMNTAFKDADDLKAYFLEFVNEYFKVHREIEPMSKSHMQGEVVVGYDTIHAYYHELKQHYSLLLVVGKNGFDTWLNDLLPAEYKTQEKRKPKGSRTRTEITK